MSQPSRQRPWSRGGTDATWPAWRWGGTAPGASSSPSSTPGSRTRSRCNGMWDGTASSSASQPPGRHAPRGLEGCGSLLGSPSVSKATSAWVSLQLHNFFSYLVDHFTPSSHNESEYELPPAGPPGWGSETSGGGGGCPGSENVNLVTAREWARRFSWKHTSLRRRRVWAQGAYLVNRGNTGRWRRGSEKGRYAAKEWVTKPAVCQGNNAKHSPGSLQPEGSGNWSLFQLLRVTGGSCWEGRMGNIIDVHPASLLIQGKPSGSNARAAVGNQLPKSLRHLPY